MESFFGIMDMLPPVSTRSYMLHNQAMAAASMSIANDHMIAASEYLHHLNSVEPHEILDVKVTCDGTWSKHGFTAIHGVVVVISYDTGQVLDFEVMSKSCTACSQQQTRLGADDGHREECLANHEGSSPVMECAEALILWKADSRPKGCEKAFEAKVRKEKIAARNTFCDREPSTDSELNLVVWGLKHFRRRSKFSA